MLDREVELLTAAGKDGKLALSHAGKVQELLDRIDDSSVANKAEAIHSAWQHRGDHQSAQTANPKAKLRSTGRRTFVAAFHSRLALWRCACRRYGAWKTVQTIALLLSVKQSAKKIKALIVAPTSVVRNWERA